MVKLFLDREEVKDSEKTKNDRFNLLLSFFFRVINNNRFLFFVSLVFSFLTALVNYNTRINMRNAFLTKSSDFNVQFNLLEEEAISNEELIKRIYSLRDKYTMGNSAKIELVVEDIRVKSSEQNSAVLSNEDIKEVFKKYFGDNRKITEEKFNFSFNFIFFTWSREMIWKQWIFSLISFLVLIKAPLSIFHWYVVGYCGDKLEKDLKVELFEILVGAKYDKSSEASGRMLTQFTSDLDNIARNIWSIPNRLAYVIVSFFLNLYFDFNSSGSGFNIAFASIAFLLFASLFIFVRFLLKKAIKLGIEAKKRYEEDNRFIFERMKRLEYIKSNSSETFEQEKISNLLERTFQSNKNSLLWTVFFRTIPNYLVIPNVPSLFMAIVTILYSRESSRENDFIFVNFVAYYLNIVTLNSEINKIIDSFSALDDLSSDLSIVTENVLNLSPSENRKINYVGDLVISNGDIVFDNISFFYPSRPDNVIVNNLSFVFKGGKRYGIAGKNGIGKSTITKILLKLYEISKGRVLINGNELSEIKTEDLHRKVCHLTNHPSFFSMSIAENVFYPFVYEKERDLGKLVKAAKKTRIFAFIDSLPFGFDTVLKEGGSDLSEGQKQQLEAAKVFLRTYDIYIFDEVLSNVHPVTRKAILKSIFEEIDKKTIIVIDHHYDIFGYMDYVYSFSSSKLSKVRKTKILKNSENI